DAALAFVARRSVWIAVGAVERLRQDPGGGGLSGAAGPREQISMSDATFGDLAGEGRRHVALADDIFEGLGPVAAVEGLVIHAGIDGTGFRWRLKNEKRQKSF